MNRNWIGGALSLALVFSLTQPTAAVDFFVATNGNDANAGTSTNAPLASLAAARDKLRAQTLKTNLADGATEITIAAWVYPDTKGANEGIVTSTGTDYFGLLFSGSGVGNPLEFRARNNSLRAADNSCPAGQWHHVAGVWKSGAIHKIYINGVEAANNAAPPSGAINTDLWYLGTDRALSARYLDGWTRDVYVWTNALSAAQISSLASTNPVVPTNALMSRLPQTTFESEQSYVLNLRPLTNGATVFLRGGRYAVTNTLTLDGRDSGSPTAPVVYRAYPGEEVIFDGSKYLPASAFALVTNATRLAWLHPIARSNVFSAVITNTTLINLLTNLDAQVSQDDRMMGQSRFPNIGFSLITNAVVTGEVLNGDGTDAAPVGADIMIHHTFIGTNWQAELARVRRARLAGYVSAQGDFETLRLHSLPTTNTIRLMDGSANGMNNLVPNYPRRPFFEQLLCEIDEPGEWYFDITDNTFYLWPYNNALTATNLLGVWAGPTMFELSCAHVRFENVTMQSLAGKIGGGEQAFVNHRGLSNVTAGCTFRYSPAGTVAYNIWGGSRASGALSCDFYDIDNASRIYSGRIANDDIEAGNSFIENCHFTQVHSKFRLGKFTALAGAGNLFRHNLVHNHNGQSGSASGVDHLIELNEVFNEGIEIADYGTFYQGASFSSWGNTFRHNFWHHIMTTPGLFERSAIFSDDGDAGDVFIENVMFKAGTGFKMNSGAGHYASGNVSLDQITAFYVLNGSPTNAYATYMSYISTNVNSNDKDNLVGRGMREMGTNGYLGTITTNNWNTQIHPYWRGRYPRLAAVADQWKAVGAANKYSDCLGTIVFSNDWSSGISVPAAVTVSNTTQLANYSIFTDTNVMSFKFKEPRPSYAAAIPFDDIGLYVDEYRSWTPDKNTYRQLIRSNWNAYESNGGGIGNYNPNTINARMYFNTGKLIFGLLPAAPSVVDLTRTSYNYDFGTPSSPVQAGYTRISPETSGDIRWTGPVDARDRSEISGGVNSINRDFVFSSAPCALAVALSNGLWRVTMNMGDAISGHDLMQVRIEGQTIATNISSPAGQYSYVGTGGGSASPMDFNVTVSDGELNLEFSDNGGTNDTWIINRLSLTRLSDDLDGDGLPNTWEQYYFGSNIGANPATDNDGDTFNNMAEYIAGTNPTNAVSRFEITTVSSAPPVGTIIGWNPSITNRYYDVLATTNLAQPFSVMQSNLVAPQNRFTNAPGVDAQQMYRVRVRLP